MMLYSIGPLTLRTSVTLPSSYDVFRCAGDSEDTGVSEICLDAAGSKPDLSFAVRKAEHTLMTVWETEDARIFEDTGHNGFLIMDRSYAFGHFWCAEDVKDQTAVLSPLLQAMVECRLIDSGVAILHSSCIAVDGRAVLFSAPSGTGKSERASKWVRYLGAIMISGDRPAVDPVSCVAYGVPWDGKEQLFLNTSAPVLAIVELRRSAATFARKLTLRQKRAFLSQQLMIPMWDPLLAQKAFIEMSRMMENINIIRLYCDITEGSIRTAYDLLRNHPERILEEKEEPLMQMKKDFTIVEIAGDYMAVPTGVNVAEFGGTVVLNEVSAFLLKLMETPVTEEELLERLLNEYEVDRETAAADLKEILVNLREVGLIE